MRVLVTGGAGYVGSHVSRRLRDRRIPHLVYDDFSTGHEAQIAGSDTVRGDISDARQLDAAFTQFRPDTVLHLAALATLGDCARRPDDCRRINAEGTRLLREIMQAHYVRDVVFAGSCAVYAAAPDAPLREDGPLGPDSAYGQSKHTAEQWLAAGGLRSVALRLFNVAGADPEGGIGEDHSPETHLLPLAIMSALGQRGPLEIYGDDYPTPDGTAVRDYVHVGDVADAFLLAADYLKNGGAPRAFNIGSGVPTSVRQLLAAVERHTQKRITVRLQPRREGDAPWLVADPAVALKTLGWRPRLSALDDIVATALAWHRRW